MNFDFVFEGLANLMLTLVLLGNALAALSYVLYSLWTLAYLINPFEDDISN